MKTFFKWVLSILLVPAGLAATFYFLNEKGYFNIQVIAVENSQQIHIDFYKPKIQVLQKKMEKLTNRPLWKVSLQDIEDDLQKLSWVESAQLTKQWPSSVILKLTLKNVPLVLYDQGLLHPILESGEILSPVSMNSAPDAIVVMGSQFKNKSEVREKTLQLLKQIPDHGSFSRKTISEIRYLPKEGFWLSLIEKDIEVKIGTDDFAEKSQRVSQVLDYISQHQIKARVIDADLSKKVLVRLRKDL